MKNYRLYINSLSNNTIITLTNYRGNVIYWSSTGKLGFKGTKKSTAYAAQLVANNVKCFIKQLCITHIDLFVKGFGYGRDPSLREIVSSSYCISSITDLSPISFNGCRSKKNRRV